MTTESTVERPAIDAAPRQLFIAGDWVAAADGQTDEIVDPSTGRPLVTAARASEADAGRAVNAARLAFDDGGWASMTPRARGRILIRAAELMREANDELAALESFDAGKPFGFTKMIDAPTAADTFEYYGSLGAGVEGATRQIGTDALSYTTRGPIGVVAAITPFNFPMILSSTKIAPALVAGNTVVHKPAEETPLTALRIAEILQ